MNIDEIGCKNCGCYAAYIGPGKGPHAYEVKCGECQRHIKWASKFDVEVISDDNLAIEIKEAEIESIVAASRGNYKEFMALSYKRDKLLEKADERI